MAIKPKKHPKITVMLNDEPVTDVLNIELRLGVGLRPALEALCAKHRAKCRCEVCQKATWEHFIANTCCFALEDALEAFVRDEMFKGNTSVISETVN